MNLKLFLNTKYWHRFLWYWVSQLCYIVCNGISVFLSPDYWIKSHRFSYFIPTFLYSLWFHDALLFIYSMGSSSMEDCGQFCPFDCSLLTARNYLILGVDSIPFSFIWIYKETRSICNICCTNEFSKAQATREFYCSTKEKLQTLADA